jgi:hypothetical protein
LNGLIIRRPRDSSTGYVPVVPYPAHASSWTNTGPASIHGDGAVHGE